MLGISRSNIRFYEKQGLFQPKRKENNYRDYSPADVAALKEIMIYRKMGFTVEEIALILKGQLSYVEGMSTVQERLEEEIPLAGFMKPCLKYNAGYVKMYLQILGES